MGLKDIFRKKKEEKKKEKKEKKRKGEKEEKKKKKERKGKESRVYSQAKQKEKKTTAWRVLRFPHISEKATKLAKENQYIFNVYKQANKIEIKKAIEGLYGVDVISVRIINVPKRKRRLGRITGWKKGYKKAIVKIKKGQEIEIIPR